MSGSGPGPGSSIAALAREALTLGLQALATGDTAAALRWLDRARRLAPTDPTIALTLASACVASAPARAASLFQEVVAQHDVRQGWLGLATARLRLSGPTAAAEPLAAVLSRHAFVADSAGLADVAGSRPGWCALRSDGGLEIHAAEPDRVRIALDGKPLRGTKLPANWPSGRRIDVCSGDMPLLGSPIWIASIRRLDGCAEVFDGGIRGWAWHPGDPDTNPVLTLTLTGHRNTKVVASDESVIVPGAGPLARPRSFRLTRDDIPSGLLHILGPDGTDLPGSPLNPAGPTRPSSTGTDGMPPILTDAPVSRPRAGAGGRKRAVTVVILLPDGGAVVTPVDPGGAVVLAWFGSVLASLPAGTRVLAVDDGSSGPALTAALGELAAKRVIGLLRLPRATGFPAAANAGIVAARGRDVVLLRRGTLVPPGWVERLRAAAYAARDIGVVAPLSNDGGIAGYPNSAGREPDWAETSRLDRLAARANGGVAVDILVGGGGCLYLRRDSLDAVGVFRADVFAQGPNHDHDLCLRARRLGWRTVALAGLFVGRPAGPTCGAGNTHLRARNDRLLQELHPDYAALMQDFARRDPLANRRRRIDLLRWRERGVAWRRAAVLIAHNDGGGVEQRLIHAVAGHAGAARRPIILRPAETAGGEPAIAVGDGVTNDLRNLIFAVPQELPALLRLLRAAKTDIADVHHLADYPPAIYDLLRLLAVPYDVHVHDYALLCPRVALVGAHDRYCGEPDLPDCEDCISANGHFLREDITVAALRDRSAAFLAAARRVVVPSDDAASRMRRHFAGLTAIAIPHHDDTALPPVAAPKRIGLGRPTVCVAGAIGIHKGYDILLACAQDAVRRDLNLEFIVVGHTIDDARLLATGRVFITGRFDSDEAAGLIAAQSAQLGFVAAICPETWCLGLSDIWRAGLRVAAFDIGAPAERIRRTGRGFLLPLGLPAGGINNTLIAAMAATGH